MSQDGRKAAKMGLQMDLGSLVVSEATEEVLTYLVDQVSFGVSVTNLDGQASFKLEGKIGNSWFTLPNTNILIDGLPGEQSNSVLFYGMCRSLNGVRCRFVSATGESTPSAAVIAMAATVNI